MGSHKSAPRRGVGEREPLRRRRQVGGKEGGRGRKEVSREDATAGGGAGPGIRQDCSSVWWGRGLHAMSLILGSGACVPGRALHLSAAPRYHPEFTKGGEKGRGSCRVVPEAGREPAELEEGKQGPRPLPSPRERAPAAPAVAGTFPLSQCLSPTGLPRSTGKLLSTTPVCTLAAWAAHPALTWERCPPPLKKKKKKLICAMPLNPRTEHAAPACSSRVHPAWKGGAGRRRWPPEGV